MTTVAVRSRTADILRRIVAATAAVIPAATTSRRGRMVRMIVEAIASRQDLMVVIVAATVRLPGPTDLTVARVSALIRVHLGIALLRWVETLDTTARVLPAVVAVAVIQHRVRVVVADLLTRMVADTDAEGSFSVRL
jgi:hypothetical protein